MNTVSLLRSARMIFGFGESRRYSASRQQRDTASRPRDGRVDLVGAGPGDPELMTLKGWRLLQQADVIVYDALVSQALLDQLPAHIPLRYVGKRKGHHAMSQNAICELLVTLAQQGQRVVRLKGGDPLVFGRLTEEMAALRQQRIPFSLVPGITAAAGCAASVGFPLTERQTAPRLRLITAHSCDDRPIDWADLARRDETLVFYMGLSMATTISQELKRHGLPADWPALLVENGTTPQQRCVHTSLGRLAEAARENHLSGPTLIYLGRVVENAQRPTTAMAVVSAARGE
ncbi:uroporphyrinogen-III C-methyltransferase [Motiliproteus sediminis]|uniref:uroporphyrinogen-III C-methyltransferase n=1 Tax=Motiliproteus sediminis TaxID=1468178 RepID=UPI001AEFA36B|nr:uroporphyrinogen-III C-methyltransferase [Motiliproteus sediminis]